MTTIPTTTTTTVRCRGHDDHRDMKTDPGPTVETLMGTQRAPGSTAGRRSCNGLTVSR